MNGNIKAARRFALPLEGICAKQTQLPPDGIKLHNITFQCGITVLTDITN